MCDLMVCNFLDIRCKIRMWVSIYDPFVSNLNIDKCLNQSGYHWIIHHTLPFFLYAHISPLCIKLSTFSINWNILGQGILQAQPRWTHDREVVRMKLPYRPLTNLEHPNTREYRENRCVLLEDIPHREIHIPAWFLTNSVWTLTT